MDCASFVIPLLLVLIRFNSGILGAWQDGLQINSHLSKETLSGRTKGKFENFREDHLSLLAWSEENLFIGARDALFNLSSTDLGINSVLNWTVSLDHQEICQVKGQKESDCHNFISLFHGPLFHTSQSESPDNQTIISEEWIVCGTNAFKPRCRLYSPALDSYREEISGVGYSPFDPTHMSTSLFHHGSTYAATVADFGGADSLIYKAPQRTEQYDSRHLSSPSFVSTLSYGELALFFFRELAVEHSNCGKVIYSRVGRICRNDAGSRKHKDRFTTFLKARLNCSVPGEFPFYFDHIQGTTSIFTDNVNNMEMLYAVFTTPENSIGASAICAFSVSDIVKAFEGPFKGQSSYDSNWLPVPSSEVPSPRPGSCPTNFSPIPDTATVAFHKEHPLMDETIQGSLTLVYASNTDRFSVVEVDPITDSTSMFEILYIGTETGKVLKVVVDKSVNSSRLGHHQDGDEFSFQSQNVDPKLTFTLNSSLISASWQVSDQGIKTLRLINPQTLLVGTDTSVVLLPTAHCQEYKSCHACVQLKDPHCFWDMESDECVSVQGYDWSYVGPSLRQDVRFGNGQFCPKETPLMPADFLEALDEIQADTSPRSIECCLCIASIPTSYDETGNNRIPELDGDFRYASTKRDHDQFKAIDGNLQMSLPRKEAESSSVKSGDAPISRGSIAMATLGSAFIALLIGFSVGFLGSRWLANKKSMNKTSATNAQFASSFSEQAQRLTPAKPIDFVVNNVNNWSGTPKNIPTPKSNLTTDALEKTVKKIYI